MLRVALCIAMAGYAVSGMAQEPTTPKPKPMPPTAEELEEFAKLAEPGPEHKRLASLAGKWSVAMRPSGKKDAAAIAVGGGEAKSILGDRFLDVAFKVEKGPLKGENRYTLGFDRRHSEYTITAADTTGTYAVTARGKPDAKKLDQIVMHGTDNDPVMKRMNLEKKFQFVLRFVGEDEFSVEIVFVDTRTKEHKAIPFATFVFKREAA